MESRQYEFSSSQNQLIKDLAKKMRFVGYFLIGIGIISVIGGLVAITQGGIGSLIQGLIQGIIYLIIGFWTTKAGSAFQQIVKTQGSDITNLMDALGELRKLYTLQYWLLIIAVILVVIGIIAAIVIGIAAS